MQIREDLSLGPYLQVIKNDKGSYGGDQNWLYEGPKPRPRLASGGCGLVAATDFELFYLGTHLRKRNAEEPLPAVKITRENYIARLIKNSRFRYPVFPRIGSSAIQVVFYVNHFLRTQKEKARMHFLFRNTRTRRLKVIKESLQNGFPVVLLLGSRFLFFGEKKGVTFYTLRDGKPVPIHSGVRRHFVTITGIRAPKTNDEPIYLEIASWGKHYFIDFEELDQYIRTGSAPFIPSVMHVK